MLKIMISFACSGLKVFDFRGQNEGGFSEDQLQMYKDCFKLIDTTELTRTPRWARARMREGSPRTSSRCTRTASSSLIQPN